MTGVTLSVSTGLTWLTPTLIWHKTFTAGDRIDILEADSLLDFRKSTRSHTVWKPPRDTPHSNSLWAPELHAFNGRWYVWYAAEDPAQGNKSHRMYVLGGPPSQNDPTVGPWKFLGDIQGLPSEQWAIDGTIFTVKNQLYLVYSGWPRGEFHSDLTQELFIVRLCSPTCASSQPVRISRPEHPWEFSHDDNGAHGINEGPQWLVAPNGAWAGIVYSCAGSWTSDYKLALLNFQGGDPLAPSSWRKGTQPLLQTKPDKQGPYGPGHGSFVNLNGEVFCVFHATDNPTDGWANRKARCQRVAWTQHGPYMGYHVGPEFRDVEHVVTKALR